MKATLACVAAAALACSPLGAQESRAVPPLPAVAERLTADDLAAWRAHLEPSAKEVSWEQIQEEIGDKVPEELKKPAEYLIKGLGGLLGGKKEEEK